MSRLLYMPRSSLPLLLTVLLGLSGSQGQEELQVLQPKEPMSVAKGEKVTLNCTVTDSVVSGPVKWFKGAGPQRKEIYNFKGGSYPRIKAAALSSNTDFSINISNITPEDTGTYYCVKFKRGYSDTEFKSGGGTMLSVSVKPSVPLVSGRQERASMNQMVNFSCNSIGFYPKNLLLKWFKNGNEGLPAIWTWVFPKEDNASYNVISTVQVLLTASDVHSEITCEVHHISLQTDSSSREKEVVRHYSK
ncbi:signal-regulatory protein beta-1-like [Monodelphis domestica]|uniref:signal-regulatory protein beta-1-like n=1 Tax=Monodelphis domestica TaxID=13616 RepID=UPI0024E22941|nr:signal-regulatory protein beta-1-like [Monodelphis domestica]